MTNEMIDRGFEEIRRLIKVFGDKPDLCFILNQFYKVLEVMKEPACVHSFVCHELFMECEYCGERQNYKPTPKEPKKCWCGMYQCVCNEPTDPIQEELEGISCKESFKDFKRGRAIREVYDRWSYYYEQGYRMYWTEPFQTRGEEELFNAIKQYCEGDYE